ncbi:MAG TPA: aspartate kinase [Gammaproteobacteria bacterium]|nr:aspartate kinase [Gammaproteobacteria bacterium]
MSLLVHKYGGTSLGSVELIRRCAERVAADHREGHQVVVVVSAMGGETDRLLGLAQQIASQPPLRELDALLASGEQVSIGLMAIALGELGIVARSYTGGQVPIVTDAVHGKARIQHVEIAELAADLEAGMVPVIAGFQGIDETGAITTLGRGGSDTTAVAVAAALGADECRIYTDVDGVYTTDPRVEPDARLLPRITIEEMLEMSSLGSKVLQIRAVEFAGKYRVPLRVLPSHRDGDGTLIGGGGYEDRAIEAPLVSGIAFARDEAEISIVGLADQPDAAARLLGPIADAHIEVDMIVQNRARDGRIDFTFTVRRAEYPKARAILETVLAPGEAEIQGDSSVAKLSLVGIGIRSHAGIATRMIAALSRDDVAVKLIATSEIKISALVEERNLERGVRTLHKTFRLDQKPSMGLDIREEFEEPRPAGSGLIG